MNLVNGLAHQESLVAEWVDPPTGIWEAMGSIPVGDSESFLCPTLVTNEHNIIFVKVTISPLKLEILFPISSKVQ